MAKKDYLKDIDEVTKGADMQSAKKTTKAQGTRKKVRKEINLDEEMINAIKSFHRGTVSSYCLMAIQNQMRDDGIL